MSKNLETGSPQYFALKRWPISRSNEASDADLYDNKIDIFAFGMSEYPEEARKTPDNSKGPSDSRVEAYFQHEASLWCALSLQHMPTARIGRFQDVTVPDGEHLRSSTHQFWRFLRNRRCFPSGSFLVSHPVTLLDSHMTPKYIES